MRDADLNIIQAAIASARSQPTVVIGEDTDILILLTYYVELWTLLCMICSLHLEKVERELVAGR